MADNNGFFDATLPNGLRVVVEPMPHVQSAAGGFLVQTGARDEPPQLAGVSHFLEHMCFKGTAKRTCRQITIDFDNMGNSYNAFTSKERTSFFGWVRVEDLEGQVELLADMMRSSLPAHEFETEKKVVLEEIATSEDQIGDRVADLVHSDVFGEHPLSWPVLGTEETIGALTLEQLRGYFESRYHAANMMLIVTGAVDPGNVMEIARRHCGDWAGLAPRPERAAPSGIPEKAVGHQTDRFQQQAVVLVFPAPSAVHEDRETADVLAYILGGPNSRFFWHITQAGVAPHVSAMRLDYCDAGLMIAFGFGEPKNAEPLLDAMRREIETVVREGVNEDEVQRVKNRVRTGLALEAESPYSRFMQLVQEVDVLGAPRTVAERMAAVERVTAGRVRAYLEAWPMQSPGCLVSLGPRAWPTA